MQENVFGIPMNVISREQATHHAQQEEVLYAVMRCADLPSHRIPKPFRERNIIVPCSKCGESCWVDPKNALPGAIPTCLRCIPGCIEPYAVSETLAEVRRQFPKA